MEKVRERSKNFKECEVNLLLNLVKKYKHIVECKKTDMTSTKDKDAAWDKISSEFNNSSGIYFRDTKTLKLKYENLKKMTKKKFAEEKRYVMGTGGGPSIKTDLTETEYKVKEIIGDLPVLGLVSQFDSDSVRPHQEMEFVDQNNGNSWDLANIPVVLEEEVGLDAESAKNHKEQVKPSPRRNIFRGYPLANHEAEVPDYDSFLSPKPTSSGCFNVQDSPKKTHATTPVREFIPGRKFNVKDLRSKTSTPLSITRKKKSVLDSSVAGKKIEVLSEAKKELMDLQIEAQRKQLQFMEQEYESKLSFMREEHEKKNRLLGLKIEKELLQIELLRKGQ